METLAVRHYICAHFTMKYIILHLSALLLLGQTILWAQTVPPTAQVDSTTAKLPIINDEISVAEYIETYRVTAISEMKRTGIPASVTLAQGIIESRHGNSRLAHKANNHFGVKCRSDWRGGRAYQKDENPNECFRRYQNPIQSFVDHSTFLAANQRYAFLFLLDLQDYRGWANGLEELGYSTSGHYAEKLIALIERNQLYAYDMAGSNTDTLGLTIPEPASYYKKYVQRAYTKKARTLDDAKFAGKVAMDKLHEFHQFDGEGSYEYVPKEDIGKSMAMDNLAKNIEIDSTLNEIYNEGIANLLPLLDNALPPDDHQIVSVSDKENAPDPNYTTPVMQSDRAIAARDKTHIAQDAQPLTIKYIVQAGDSLFSIAKRFGVSINELAERNKITADALKIGNQLLIYIR